MLNYLDISKILMHGQLALLLHCKYSTVEPRNLEK